MCTLYASRVTLETYSCTALRFASFSRMARFPLIQEFVVGVGVRRRRFSEGSDVADASVWSMVDVDESKAVEAVTMSTRRQDSFA